MQVIPAKNKESRQLTLAGSLTISTIKQDFAVLNDALSDQPTPTSLSLAQLEEIDSAGIQLLYFFSRCRGEHNINLHGAKDNIANKINRYHFAGIPNNGCLLASGDEQRGAPS